MSLRSFIEDAEASKARLTQLLSQLGKGTYWFPKVHPGEVSKEILETLGFRAAGGHRLYATKARSD